MFENNKLGLTGTVKVFFSAWYCLTTRRLSEIHLPYCWILPLNKSLHLCAITNASHLKRGKTRGWFRFHEIASIAGNWLINKMIQNFVFERRLPFKPNLFNQLIFVHWAIAKDILWMNLPKATNSAHRNSFYCCSDLNPQPFSLLSPLEPSSKAYWMFFSNFQHCSRLVSAEVDSCGQRELSAVINLAMNPPPLG